MCDRVCLRIERETCFMTYTADPSHFLIQLLPSNDNPRYRQLIFNTISIFIKSFYQIQETASKFCARFRVLDDAGIDGDLPAPGGTWRGGKGSGVHVKIPII